MGGGGGGGGMGGRGGGMSGMGERPRTLRKSEPISYDLAVNLDDLYTGKLKKVRITKKVEVNGRIEQRKVDKEIHIKPGWKSGTKITFERAGDELPGIQPADIIFVVHARPHDFYERDGDDLIYNVSERLEHDKTMTYNQQAHYNISSNCVTVCSHKICCCFSMS
jgi:DnaJ family protein B protein 4